LGQPWFYLARMNNTRAGRTKIRVAATISRLALEREEAVVRWGVEEKSTICMDVVDK